MTTPITKPGAPTATGGHTSARWPGGQAQGTPAWCFAAAEQIAQSAFGVAVTQAQIAHDVLMARGAAQDNSQGAVTYYDGVQNLFALNGLNDASWASVGALVTIDSTLNNIHRGAWGQPPLTGRTATAGGALTNAQITATIDADGLVLAGNAMHWKVIYGYTTYSDGSVTYLVFDPMTNASSTVASGTVIAAMQISYRVTG